MDTPHTAAAAITPCPVELIVRRENAVAVDPLIRSDAVTRIQPGVYAHTAEWRRLSPWERYLARVYAVHARRPHAVFALESAAALLGLPLVGRLHRVYVLAERKGSARLSGIVQGHYLADAVSYETTESIRHTSLLDTAIDVARHRHVAYGLAVMNHLAGQHGAPAAAMSDLNDARSSARGRGAADWAITRMTSSAESVLESISLAAIEWLGYASPRLQVPFSLGELGSARVDAYWPDADVVGEADGDAKYRMGAGGADDAVLREKRREDALRRRVSGFVRWGWDDCRRPDRLDAKLASAGLVRRRPRDNTRLRTLESFLAP